MNWARNKARPDPKLYIFKKNKCLFQFTLDLIRVSPALSQKHKYQFSAEVSCLPLSEKHLLRTTASSCSRKLLSPFYKNTREQFALLEPSGGTGPELTMSRYPLRIDGFGLFIDSLHSSDASSTLPAWALRFWTAAAHADVCVCVSTAGPIFLSRVVFDDYQWKWCHEIKRKRETRKLSWNAAVASIRRSFFTFIFARDAEDKRTTVLANAEDSRFSLRVTVLACIPRFYDNFFVVTASFWHRTVFSLLHRCASSSSVHERQTETMERRIPKN